MNIFEAAIEGATVITHDGYECIILAIKDGIAKVQRYTEHGTIATAKVPVDSLKVKR